ncbi:MAG TPA: MFS transporter [Pyrinomonadaceae bacterium]|nr:MFS transporter [Pyrinomonadaceae bacterium]
MSALSESRWLRYAVFFYLYVMQGVPAGFSLTAVTNYLTAEGVSPAVTGSFVAAVGLPWTVQFVWGPIIDWRQNSPMGRRRPWVVLSMLLAFVASLGLLFVSDPPAQVAFLSLTFFIHSVFDSVQDASVDAMAITVTPADERGRVNAFMRGGILFGVGVGAAGLGYLIRHIGFVPTALIHSLLLLVMTAVVFFVRERPEDSLLPWRRDAERVGLPNLPPGWNLGRIFRELFRGLLGATSLRLFGAILLVYLCLSVFIRTFSVHMIRELKWEDASLSVLTGTYGMLMALLVTLVVGALSDRVGLRRLLLISMSAIGAFLLIFNFLAPLWTRGGVATGGLILWYTFDPSFSIAAMPILMSLCRKGVEGSQFTTYMALVNLSDVLGAYVSGHALAWVTAPTIGLCCGAAIIGAMLSAGWLTRTREVAV